MISWTDETIAALQEIVSHFNKHLGRSIEIIADFYIERHDLFLKFENYSMSFSKTPNNEISDGVYKLAFICDLSHLVNCIKNNQKYEATEIQISDVYKHTSNILTYTFPIVSFLNQKQLRFNDYFLVDLLKNVIKEDKMIKYNTYNIYSDNLFRSNSRINPNKRNIDIISIAYYLTLDLIKIDKKHSVYDLHTLITESQTLDISILTPQQIKNIKEILGVKRTIFVRILLILTNEMIRNEHTIEKITNKGKFTNKTEFTDCMNTSMTEVSVFLTSYQLKNNKIMF